MQGSGAEKLSSAVFSCSRASSNAYSLTIVSNSGHPSGPNNARNALAWVSTKSAALGSESASIATKRVAASRDSAGLAVATGGGGALAPDWGSTVSRRATRGSRTAATRAVATSSCGAGARSRMLFSRTPAAACTSVAPMLPATPFSVCASRSASTGSFAPSAWFTCSTVAPCRSTNCPRSFNSAVSDCRRLAPSPSVVSSPPIAGN